MLTSASSTCYKFGTWERKSALASQLEGAFLMLEPMSEKETGKGP